MIDVFEAAAEVDVALAKLGLPYVFIGGLALQAWGEARLTRDVDVSLLTGFVDEEKSVDALLASFEGRIADARSHALRHRVLLLRTAGRVGIDIGLAGFPYEEDMIGRSVRFEFLPDVTLPILCAEDLIVMKAFAGRDRDWDDIRGICSRQEHLDWGLIESSLVPLLEIKESPEDFDRLMRTRAES